MKPLLVISILFSLSATANAQIFKCVKPDGGLEFSSIPCSADVGDASLAVKRQYQPSDADRLESEVAHLRNKVSTNVLSTPKQRTEAAKVGGGLTIIPDNTKGTVADRERKARREARQASGETRISTNCFSYGQVKDCYDSQGGKYRSTSNGGYTHTYGADGDGNRVRKTEYPNGSSSTRIIPAE